MRHEVFPDVNASSLVSVLFAKEAREILASQRGQLWLVTLAGVLSVVSLLFVANTELSLLDNAQVVYDMMGLILALGSLLAMVSGVDAIGGERERGSLVPLLLSPLSRNGIIVGKLGAPLAAWAAMLVLSLPYLWAVGSSGQNLVPAAVSLVVLGTPVVLAFGFLGLTLGAWLAAQRTALAVSLMLLVVSASPLLLGPSLRQSAIGGMFDAINPISGALKAFDAVVIDSQSLWQQGHHALPVIGFLILSLVLASTTMRALSR
jgi:ABC-2 type transport system permease protein